MSPNQIEFKITKDSSAQNVDLDNMSIEASAAFVVLLNSMNNILKYYNSNNEIKVKLVKGSAAINVVSTENIISTIESDFEDVLGNKSGNQILVENWREIQKVLSSDGLEYEAKFAYTNKPPSSSLVTRLRTSNQIRLRKTEYIFTGIEFLTGKLIEVGGKTPNIHILDQFDNKIKIGCTEGNAKVARRYLYEPLYVSAFCRTKDNFPNLYWFCDVYNDGVMMNELNALYNRIFTTDSVVGQLINIHDIGKEVLEKDPSYIMMRRFMKMFDYEYVDYRYMKSLMVLTKGIKNHGELGGIREKIVEKYNKRN
ncbi:hypothetical protein SAMN05660461_1840 [Chitinophaga ginsengisegetis]|uniref:Uncharacterized protein n=1 Tax=Chitinophaga ginsengisegetis TaxID=393003 RepID=A0A1T5NJ70_9BACT|nr:hypothetical protein [Chitinophaga ginsengisegetis]SKD00494.1 hypothetical protein SAMN05660461_1840 [Chitinophaga ginsengisegetis]